MAISLKTKKEFEVRWRPEFCQNCGSNEYLKISPINRDHQWMVECSGCNAAYYVTISYDQGF